MSGLKSDRARLLHIQDAIQSIFEYVEGNQRDNKTRDAVIRQLQIIGEASNHLSMELRKRYPLIPWHDVINMRHHLTHGYFQVDLQEVWDTVDNDLAALRDTILSMLEDKTIL